MKILYIVFAILLSFNVLAGRSVNTEQPGMDMVFLKSEAGSFAKSVTFGASNCPTISATTQIDISATTVFTSGDHLFDSGDKVRITTTVTVPLGADADTDYYVENLTDDTFRLASTKILAMAGTPDITFTSTGLGVHTVCMNGFKVTAHGFVEGDRVQVTTTSTVPTGIAVLTDYWIDKVNANLFNLKTVHQDTVPLDWTDVATDTTATGTLTVTKTDEFAGLSKFRVTITASETGIYLVDRKEAFASADQIGAMAVPITDACQVRITSQTATRSIVNATAAADGTTEMDCYFQLMIYGSNYVDSY